MSPLVHSANPLIGLLYELSINFKLSGILESHLDKLDKNVVDELDDLLDRFQSPSAMNLESMDGFFAALHCCPDMVPPSEYLPKIWGGGEMPDDVTFDDKEQANHFFSIVMAHWNNVGDRLNKDVAFLPLLDETELAGEKWAQGFLRGTEYMQGDWSDLLDDEEKGGMGVVIFALAHQNNPDPELRSFDKPLSDEKHEDLLVHLAASVTDIYRYFEGQRRFNAELIKGSGVFRHSSPKIGRNAPCPCGSGKKYKKCCAAMTVH